MVADGAQQRVQGLWRVPLDDILSHELVSPSDALAVASILGDAGLNGGDKPLTNPTLGAPSFADGADKALRIFVVSRCSWTCHSLLS